MNVRWLKSKVLMLLLALTIPCANRLPQRVPSAPSKDAMPLRLGHSDVLSDFDADGLVDEARVESSSLRKSVGILLSGTGKRSFLHFNANRPSHGTLIARDIDNDGATDLIWTDCFRANDVVVWLGDGRGRFEQVDSAEYGGAFDLLNTEIAEPDDSNQETAINSESERPLDQALSPKRLDKSASELPSDYPDRLDVLSPAMSRPSGRAPPSHLS